MVGLDTNVRVRFLAGDDPPQFERARRLIGREAGGGQPVLISLLVLLECGRVLSSRYGLGKAEIIGAFSGLLGTAEVRFEDEACVEEALYVVWKESAAEFADGGRGARHRALGCRYTASFDARAARLPGFTPA
jgi:predicted nucleic-acid-binding protein